MESALFLAVTAAGMAAFVARRGVLTGVLLTTLFAVRAEGLLLAVVLVVAWAIRERRPPTRLVLGGLLSGVAWVGIAFAFTGHLLPDTLSAKVAQGRSGYWGGPWSFLRGLDSHSQFFRSWFLALCALAVVGVVYVVRNRRLWCYVAPLVAFALLHLLFYGVVFQVPSYSWYYGIEVLVLCVLGAIGIGGVARGFVASSSVRPAALVVALALLAAVVVLGVRDHQRGDSVAHYRDVAQWFRRNTPPRASIAATEIGTIGWVTERPMVDYLGLLSRDSAREVRRADFVTWLERERPDYWLVHSPPWSFEASALASESFRDHYVLRRELNTRAGRVARVDFQIYERR
jgi:hypothetical protein